MTDLHPSVTAGGALSPEEITRKLAEGYTVSLVPPGGPPRLDRDDFDRIVDETRDAINEAYARFEQPSQITLWGLPLVIDYAGRLDPGETFRIESPEPRRSQKTPNPRGPHAREEVSDPLKRP